jgi:signal transduction histidine kinase/CheY-like chemotaxis protein
MTVPPSVPNAAAPSPFPGKRGEQDFRLAPTLLGTFGIVIAILGGYEFGLSGRLESLGIWENILTIAIGAVVAVAPVYIALRKQRILHRYALFTLSDLRKAEAERERSEKQKELQRGVTEILALGVPLGETYLKILERLCGELRWEVGGLWIVDRSAKVLRCAEIWYPPSTEYGRLAALSRATTLAPGQSLPGAVWADGRAASSADVALDPRCERRAMAAELGLRGWVGFPIMLPRQILGVVEFFSVNTQSPDETMLAALTAIGLQIGQFIERRQLEEQFRQAQKMEAVGTLSGGIAHDFNNIIGAISGYTELARMDAGENPRVVAHLDEVLQGAKRAAELVRQILAFSRQQEQVRKPIQLRLVVAEALKLLRAMIPASIEFEVSMATDVPTVLADSTQIHQIVMNLGTNASHAMKDRMGRLTVTLENFDVGADGMETHLGLQSGRYVRLSISDTGHGMDQATLSRIFEPFFTTKAPGEGTGLGLAVVQGIMQSHEGIVTAYSHQGEGTTFHLYFPVCGMEEAATGSGITAVPRGEGERILYVDDELPLAQMGGKILERLGYVVEVHTSALEALEAVRAKPEAYDLIITDQMMPRLTGLDLARGLQTIRPGLPIILVTGYTATLTAERVKAMGISNLLLKPISVATLGAAVHRVLAEADALSLI